MTVLAHVAHWYHSLLYAAPIVLIALALWWSGRREEGSRGAKKRVEESQAAEGEGRRGPSDRDDGDEGKPGQAPLG